MDALITLAHRTPAREPPGDCVLTISDLRERLVQRGRRVTGGPAQWTAQCPAHEDDRPSLRLASGQDGRPLLHCMAGCAPDDILSALELTWSDVLPPRAEQGRERPQHVATYTYRDLEGNALYEVRRFAPKTFRPYLPGASRPGLPSRTRPAPGRRDAPWHAPDASGGGLRLRDGRGALRR